MRSSLQPSKENISAKNIAPAVVVGPNLYEITGKIRYWNGQGTDYKWSNPLNWLGGTIPTQTDCVIFDGRCVKNVVVDTNAEIKALIIAADYTGSISGWNDLIISDKLLLQGGVCEVSLLSAGEIIVENGTLHSCFSTEGNLTISGGQVIWESGEVAGNTILKAGLLKFSSNYNRYYSFKGDFIKVGGQIEGTPLFRFYGNKPQVFNAGLEEMKLLDLYNTSQLHLQGNVKIESFFFNAGTLKVKPASTLDLETVNCFSNTGLLIAEGTITPSIGNKPIRQKKADNISKIEMPVTDETFTLKTLDSAQTTEKSLVVIN